MFAIRLRLHFKGAEAEIFSVRYSTGPDMPGKKTHKEFSGSNSQQGITVGSQTPAAASRQLVYTLGPRVYP